MILSKLIEPVGKLLDKLIPDADKRQEAKVKLAELSMQKDDALIELTQAAAVSQHQLNRIDAESNDKYRTRWRPSLGWICVFGLGWSFVLRPFMEFVLLIFGIEVLAPTLDTAAILALVTTLLGMGTLRTYEKMGGR